MSKFLTDLILSICKLYQKIKKIKKAESDPTITYGDQNVGIPFNQRKSCTTKEKNSNHRQKWPHSDRLYLTKKGEALCHLRT